MSSRPGPNRRRQATKRARMAARRRARAAETRPTEWRVPVLTTLARQRELRDMRSASISDDALFVSSSVIDLEATDSSESQSAAGTVLTKVAEPKIAPSPSPVSPTPLFAPRPPRKVSRRRRRAQRLVAGLMTLLVVAGACLAFVGFRTVRGSTAGKYVDPTLIPEDPGFAAYVTPTPTLLVVHRLADGQLGGVTLLSLQPGDQGGSVILMPAGTRGMFGPQPVSFVESYANGGAEAVKMWVETVLKMRVDDTVEIDDARWTELVTPVGPLNLELDEPVAHWATGPITVQPQEVGLFLGGRGEGQSELVRTDRQSLFWQAWLQRVEEVGAAAVPGEVSTGLGRFVRRIAAAPDDVAVLPVASVPDAPFEQFEMNGMLSAEILARAVPYPASPAAGVRPRVRLLNGTNDPDLNVRAARALVAGGAEITISGNADSFDVPTTAFFYSDPEMKDVVTLFQTLLGIGVVETETSDEDVAPIDDSDRIDMTVVLGADAPEALRSRR